MYGDLQPSRTDVRKATCPECGAPPESPCIGVRGKIRVANHAGRVQAYHHGDFNPWGSGVQPIDLD